MGLFFEGIRMTMNLDFFKIALEGKSHPVTN